MNTYVVHTSTKIVEQKTSDHHRDYLFLLLGFKLSFWTGFAVERCNEFSEKLNLV